MNEIFGLSLIQPWATLLATFEKTIETRWWQTNHRGLIAIHASKQFPSLPRALCYENGMCRTALESHGYTVTSAVEIHPPLPTGKILGVAWLKNCKPTHEVQYTLSAKESAFGDYGPLRFAWQFERAELLVHPVPCKGARGLWKLPESVLEAVLSQLREFPRPLAADTAAHRGGNPMIFNEVYFGVSIGDGANRILAFGENTTPKLFLRKSDAMRFKRELDTHIDSKCRVVALACKFEILERRV